MSHALAAAGQVWPAFVLVTGLLLVGVVAEADGLFAAAGARIARLPTGPHGLFLASLGLVALVTAVLNLDTSVFFLTPVLLHVARARGAVEAPFLYGTVFMSNSASLFLPGSNLTNLIVLHGHPIAGGTFLTRFLPASIAAVLSTAAVLLAWFFRELHSVGPGVEEHPALRLAAGAPAVAAAVVLVLVLANPALPVLAVGTVAVLASRVDRGRVRAAVNLPAIGLLFALSIALGSLGRVWGGPERLLGRLDRLETAAVAAAASIAINNLPAAVVFSTHEPRHLRALLLGVNLGPNLAVTGSLSAVLWLSVARTLGAKPSPLTYSRIGVVLTPVTLAAALGALRLF